MSEGSIIITSSNKQINIAQINRIKYIQFQVLKHLNNDVSGDSLYNQEVGLDIMINTDQKLKSNDQIREMREIYNKVNLTKRERETLLQDLEDNLKESQWFSKLDKIDELNQFKDELKIKGYQSVQRVKQFIKNMNQQKRHLEKDVLQIQNLIDDENELNFKALNEIMNKNVEHKALKLKFHENSTNIKLQDISNIIQSQINILQQNRKIFINQNVSYQFGGVRFTKMNQQLAVNEYKKVTEKIGKDMIKSHINIQQTKLEIIQNIEIHDEKENLLDNKQNEKLIKRLLKFSQKKQ